MAYVSCQGYDEACMCSAEVCIYCKLREWMIQEWGAALRSKLLFRSETILWAMRIVFGILQSAWLNHEFQGGTADKILFVLDRSRFCQGRFLLPKNSDRSNVALFPKNSDESNGFSTEAFPIKVIQLLSFGFYEQSTWRTWWSLLQEF